MQSLFSATLRPSYIAESGGIRLTISPRDVVSYNHTVSAFGGYDTAQLSVKIRRRDIDLFLMRALGSDVKILTGETETIWEGVINEITTTYNGADISVGPLLDVANKVLVRYTDFATGVAGITTYANDTISQDRYGVFVKILAASTVSAVNADGIRDKYLEDNRWPFYNVALTTQTEDTFLVNLSCVGYFHLLSTYVYNNLLTTTYTAREKIIEVLAAHPDSIFNRSGLIAANTLSVPRLENEDRLAVDVIKELVSLGSATSNTRMTFGVYNDRSIVYKAIPTTIRYFYRSYNNNKYMRTQAGAKVHIATLKPGQFIVITDLPNNMASGLRTIPRNIFIETVNYTAPYGLSITGSNVSTLEQKLAKLGLSGIS